ncbi:hypothetical protein HOY82DRAFT_553926, partial [Tuber indicum]
MDCLLLLLFILLTTMILVLRLSKCEPSPLAGLGASQPQIFFSTTISQQQTTKSPSSKDATEPTRVPRSAGHQKSNLLFTFFFFAQQCVRNS